MKIAFITGCLEDGKDGVGDYTRKLAMECQRQGHASSLLSINDPFVNAPLREDIEFNNARIPQMRLPMKMPWKTRIELAREFLDTLMPDFVSVQFVPYAFHNKGIIYGAGRWLNELLSGHKVHIMFHETWVGEYPGAPWKHKIMGSIQRIYVLELIKNLKPLIMHTNAMPYVAMLEKYHVRAGLLPLFGSMPVSDRNGSEWIFPILQKAGVNISAENRGQFWLFGIFGTIYPTWQVEPLFTYIRKAAAAHNKKIVLISIGQLRAGEELFNKIADTYSPYFVSIRLGEQPADIISQFLNTIDFGLTSVPWKIIEKSASVVSMLEHGVPVIVSRAGSRHASCYSPEALLHIAGPSLPDDIIGFRRGPRGPRISRVVSSFINDLLGCLS